jgi:hypothetical protein
MLIRAWQQMAADPPRPPRQGVAENASDGGAQNGIAVLLPHPVERSESRGVELAGRSSEPRGIVVAYATTIDLSSLPEVPRQLLPGVNAQGHGHLLTRGGLEDIRGLTQMFRNEQAQLPFR